MATELETPPDATQEVAACRPCAVNMPLDERIASGVAGGALMAYGLGRGSLGGLVLAAAGGGLLYRGLSGHCMLYAWLGIDRTGSHNQSESVQEVPGKRDRP